jgi:hypothetical protein
MIFLGGGVGSHENVVRGLKEGNVIKKVKDLNATFSFYQGGENESFSHVLLDCFSYVSYVHLIPTE